MKICVRDSGNRDDTHKQFGNQYTKAILSQEKNNAVRKSLVLCTTFYPYIYYVIGFVANIIIMK